MSKGKFLKLFDEVFDQEGNIKPCGREICAKLIKLAERVDQTPPNLPNFFGISDPENPKYGYMNVPRMKALHERIIKKF